MDSAPFYILLFVHLTGLVLGFGSVLVTDLHGLLWLRDRVRFPQLVEVSGVTEKFIWAGWGTMVAAGIPLVLMKGVVDNLMTIKLAFVAIIGLNGIALHLMHNKIEEFEEGDEVPDLVFFRLSLTLGVSQLAWWGAMTIGFLHRHIWTIIEWPSIPWVVIGLIVAGILGLWGLGEIVFRRTHKTVEA